MTRLVDIRTEASYWARSELKSQIVNLTLGLGLVGCTYGAFRLPFEYKHYAMLPGLAMSVAGVVNCKFGKETGDAGQDLRKVSDMARTTRYYEQTRTDIRLPELPKPFDWTKLRDEPDLYPHMLLVGASGGGKSSFAENLGGLLGGDTYGVIPHYQSGDYRSCKRIWCDENNIGNGADFDRRAFKPRTSLDDWETMLHNIPCDNNDPMVTWRELEEGTIVNPTVCQVFRALWFEMRRRYKRGADGKFIGGNRINLIVDEFNSLANLPGLRKLWLELAREARKIGITLALIVQQNDVTSLNVEGQGSIRDNFTAIYFGRAADEKILENISLVGNDDNLRQFWLDKLKEYHLTPYRAMVERDWCMLPPPNSWVVTEPVDHSYYQAIYDQREVTSQAPAQEAKTPVDFSQDELEEFYRLAVDAANQGMTKPRIINKVWGFSKNFGLGQQIWRRIESEVGKIHLLPQQNLTSEE